MDRISNLSDELLGKILSYLPTKLAVSTSVLSKKWEFLWMLLSKLEYNDENDISGRSESLIESYRDFIDKNLPLHRAPIIESLTLNFSGESVEPEDIESWAENAVSRSVRKLSICYVSYDDPVDLLPSSLYTCKSLVKLALEGNILVDLPRVVSLPALKTLYLGRETFLSKGSLRRLLSRCPVLEDLSIDYDSAGALVVIVPSLLRLSLAIAEGCSSKDEYVIDTPALKYFNVKDYRETSSYVIKHMPELEEVSIDVKRNPEKILGAVTSVKRLTLDVLFHSDEEPEYYANTVFNRLEHLKLFISSDHWSKLLVRLLKDSPELRILNLYVSSIPFFEMYNSASCWNNEQRSVSKYFLKSLETFEFEGYKGRPEERDFLSHFFKHAGHLRSSSISHRCKDI